MTTQHKHKNIILMVSGVADTFFSPTSRRQLAYTNDLDKKIQNVIDNNKDKIFGYIDLLNSNDQRRSVKLFDNVRKQRVINVRFNGKSLLDSSNDVNITEEDGNNLLVTGKDLDFVLRPQDYEIHICGVDLHGMYKNTVQELLAKGYKVYLYSDMIKRYSDTEEHIKAIRNGNFEYCSSRLALA